MDIHRCRFVPYEASAINAVAFSHAYLSTSNKHSKTTPVRLAIGRANGDIEIWNPLQGTWLQEMTISGGRGRSIEGLAWTVDADEELEGGRISHGRMRLFSIGYTNTITEWDLAAGRARRHASGQHGDIWCLAAQPRAPAGAAAGAASAAAHQRLVGGTSDGCLVLYATDDDGLRFQRLCRTHKKNVRMMSIAFQSRQLAVVGCSDSTVRVFDVRNGAVLHALTLGRDLAGGVGARDVIVWSVRCLANGDLVSADSTGQISIWDGRTYTQAQRIQAHSQDVLSLAVSADGSAIVSGGMDRRVVLYRQVHGASSTGTTARWTKVWHRRYHRHDVKALAAFEGRGLSVVVAAGPDTTPVVLPLHASGSEHHRTLSHLPQTVPVASAPDARLVVCWWARQAHVWALDVPPAGDCNPAGDSNLNRHRRLVARIQVRGDANIAAGAISPDGRYVVLATATDVKAFQLRRPSADADDAGDATNATNALVVSKIPVPAAVAARGASSVAISPDGGWVSLGRGADDRLDLLQAVRLPDASDPERAAGCAFRPAPVRLVRLPRAIPRYETVSGLGSYDRRVQHLVFSPDSRMLAAADLAGYVDTWVLRRPDEADSADEADPDETRTDDEDEDEDEADKTDDTPDANGRRWIRNPRARQFPKLAAAPVVLSFAPDVPGVATVAGGNANGTDAADAATDYVLLAVTATARLLAFNPLRARLVPWFRRLSPASLPVEYRNVRDLVKGVLWQGPRLWLYGASFVFMLDTSMDAPAAGAVAETATPKKKRKRGDDGGAGNKMARGRLEPQRVQMTVPGDAGTTQWVDVEMHSARVRDDDDDDDDSSSDDEAETDADADAVSHDPSAKKGRRRRQRKLASEEASQALTQTAQDPATLAQSQQARPPTRWWHTFKYRPILGMVPLAAADAVVAEDATAPAYPPLEVALVERPAWDMELPERFDDE